MNTAARHFFYLAPIRGVTDAPFRTLFHTHFPYFDASVAPFINPQKYSTIKDKFLRDILPQDNSVLAAVPQLLYNSPEDFIHLGRRLEDMGYCHINWNLGCPAPMVANKQRGSGLLPHTERIAEMAENITSSLECRLSIKTRLGFHQPSDLLRLLPLLEPLPLEEIIIHPRIGKQLYTGSVDLDTFERCLHATSHSVVYNGDICTPDDFHRISTRFPQIERWMIGRGAIANPFLVAEIHGQRFDGREKVERIASFHDDIYGNLKSRLSGSSHLLSRMKQIWVYLIGSFTDSEKALKKILKARNEGTYLAATAELLRR